MSIWSVLAGKVNPMKVLKGIGGFIDESFLSKEEVQKAIVEHAKTTLKESTPRSLTRRYIAVSFIGVFLFLVLGAAGSYFFNKEYAEFIFKIIDNLFGIVITIVIFYFGGYYGGKFIKKKE
jgi:divalent metal cation (Fe/Co/Zn/Cd) transporter